MTGAWHAVAHVIGSWMPIHAAPHHYSRIVESEHSIWTGAAPVALQV